VLIEGETADEVLMYARSRGWTISRTQLERRHRAGAIQSPRQVARGRGAGTVSIYPPGTSALIVEGLELGNLPLSRISFEMWLCGRPVPMDGVRDYLIATATLHDRVARVLQIFGFGGAVLPNRVLRWVAKIARRQQPAGIGLIRRRLDNDQGRTETVIRASAEMVAGVYVPPQYVMGPDDDEGNLFEAVLGIEAASIEAPIGLQPWRRGSLTETLVDATRDFAGEWTRDLTSLADEDLGVGRARLLVLRDFVATIEDMREMYGRQLFGFGALADGYRLAKSIVEPAAVFVFARKARAGEDQSAQFDAISRACTELRELVSLPLLRAFRGYAPTAELFSQKRLYAVLTRATAKAQWEQEAGAVGVRYKAEIAELFVRTGVDPKRFAVRSTPAVATN